MLALPSCEERLWIVERGRPGVVEVEMEEVEVIEVVEVVMKEVEVIEEVDVGME